MEDKNLLIQKHVIDLRQIFPQRLLISKKELSQLRTRSESTFNREIANGIGIPYKKEGGMIMYPLRDIAAWMADKPYMDIDQDLLTDKHIEDILDIFPGQLLISKYQLAKLRGTSESTLNREKKRSEGIPPKEKGGRTLYLVRDTAEWLSSTIKTTNKRRRIDENNR